MRCAPGRYAVSLLLVLGATSCTNDYGAFQFSENGGTGNQDAGTGATGGGGTGGMNVGGSGGLNVGGTGGTNVGGTGGTNVGGTGGTQCAGANKLCNGQCVPIDNPASGCAAQSCDPCSFANATPQCYQGACAILSCASGFDNCDGNAATGCERAVDTTTDCGACDRACSTQNSTGAVCQGGACVHSCDPGFGDCIQPTASAADDGCETDLQSSLTHCGSCANNCAAQGAAGGFSCNNSICACSANAQCVSSAGTSNASCNTSLGRCVCGGASCQSGEVCVKKGGSSECSCNGGAACSAGQTCCESPAGCFELQSDTQNCGACGAACASGQSCVAGVCTGGDAGTGDAGSDASDAAGDAADAASDAADAAGDAADAATD